MICGMVQNAMERNNEGIVSETRVGCVCIEMCDGPFSEQSVPKNSLVCLVLM